MTVLPVLLLVALSLVHAGADGEKPRNETDSNRAPPVKNDVIAFSAEVFDHDEIPAGSTIVFDQVITNVGGMYFDANGLFGCPDDGLYVFVWNFLCDVTASLPGMRCIGSLRSGGIDRKYGPKTSYHLYTSEYTGVSEMTAVLECSTDPPTAVSITSQPWAGGIGSVSRFFALFTSFSGFKLHDGVAFTAELSENRYIIPGGRIMFDNVIANHGGHYDVTNGHFRCPDAGVYVFSVTTQTSDPSTPWSVSRLMMEREVVMQGPMTFIATADYDSGSASITAVLHCTPDLSIYVEAQAAHDFTHNSYGAELTSFTGFKLYDLTPETVAFTAVITQNFTSGSTLRPILFDKVITNIGGAFDISTSSFVCPDDDHYLFTWSAVLRFSALMSLYMDGSFVKANYARAQSISADTGTSGSCSQTIILRCQPGSWLQVMSDDSDVHYLGGYSSFSGYKIPG